MKKNIHIDSFSKDSLDSARKHYNGLEKNNNIDVVLISLDNQKKLNKPILIIILIVVSL